VPERVVALVTQALSAASISVEIRGGVLYNASGLNGIVQPDRPSLWCLTRRHFIPPHFMAVAIRILVVQMSPC